MSIKSSLFAPSLQTRSAFTRRTGLLLSLAALFLAATVGANAQLGAQATQVHDSSALKPPAGARVAVVEFADMECPDCARANPLLKEATAKYKIPWVRYDFPLSMHVWSKDAAIYARWFEVSMKNPGLANQYRDEVFSNQTSIYNKDLLRRFTEKFAQSHGMSIPFAIDPQGKLTAAVEADYGLGQRIGLDHTPTIWVVTSNSKGAPYIEVTDRSKLYQIIDQALADTSAPVKATAKAPANKKTPTKK